MLRVPWKEKAVQDFCPPSWHFLAASAEGRCDSVLVVLCAGAQRGTDPCRGVGGVAFPHKQLKGSHKWQSHHTP